ncbi:hypothetical protein [Variovorax paradoxus]|uniref:hypothetical protein n=1 Tax=Variovorax paradoxus TaxID=34073 RepID=UPI00399BE09D
MLVVHAALTPSCSYRCLAALLPLADLAHALVEVGIFKAAVRWRKRKRQCTLPAPPVGDNLARQIEQHCEVEPGWLDKEDRPSEVPDAAEERFIAAAREAWRQANAKGKTELSGWLKQRAARAPGEEPPP